MDGEMENKYPWDQTQSARGSESTGNSNSEALTRRSRLITATVAGHGGIPTDDIATSMKSHVSRAERAACSLADGVRSGVDSDSDGGFGR